MILLKAKSAQVAKTQSDASYFRKWGKLSRIIFGCAIFIIYSNCISHQRSESKWDKDRSPNYINDSQLLIGFNNLLSARQDSIISVSELAKYVNLDNELELDCYIQYLSNINKDLSVDSINKLANHAIYFQGTKSKSLALDYIRKNLVQENDSNERPIFVGCHFDKDEFDTSLVFKRKVYLFFSQKNTYYLIFENYISDIIVGKFSIFTKQEFNLNINDTATHTAPH